MTLTNEEKLATVELTSEIQTVVIEELKQKIESLKEQTERGTRNQRRILRTCQDIAREIAMCGSSDHRAKNVAILNCIARLLTLCNHYAEPASVQDMDDIPF